MRPLSRSEQRNGLSIERDAKVATAFRLESLHEEATEPRELSGFLGLDEHVPAPAILDALYGTGRGTDQGYALEFSFRDQLAHPIGRGLGELRDAILGEPAEDDVRQP